ERSAGAGFAQDRVWPLERALRDVARPKGDVLPSAVCCREGDEIHADGGLEFAPAQRAVGAASPGQREDRVTHRREDGEELAAHARLRPGFEDDARSAGLEGLA